MFIGRKHELEILEETYLKRGIPTDINVVGIDEPEKKAVQYLFFSLSGYSKWMIENTDLSMVRLLTLDDLYN